MINATGAINNTVSFSQFNKGQAGKIFEDVKKNGTKVVIKNNCAECVLMSPDEYVILMEIINDYRLEALASQRMLHFSPDKLIPESEVLQDFGISEEDLADFDEVDIE